MATCGQPHLSSGFVCIKTMYSPEHRPPVHDRSPVSVDMTPRTIHRPDAYIGEGLIDVEKLHDLETQDEADVQHKSLGHNKKVLDFLATDVAERYLDDIYKEDENDSDNTEYEEHINADEPIGNQDTQHQSTLPSIWRAAITKSNEEGPNHANPKTKSGLRQKALTAKEIAWQKVRHLLIKEEEQAALREDQSPSSGYKSLDEVSVSSKKSDDSYTTVKLLDYLAQTNLEGSAHTHSVSSDGDTDSAIETSRISLTGSTGAVSPYHGNAGSGHVVSGGRSTQLELLAMLEQVKHTFETTELSEASITRISSRLASISQIARDDMYKSSQRLRQESRPRLNSAYTATSSTTRPKSGHDKSPTSPSPSETLRVPSAIRKSSVAPTVLKSFKAFAAGQDLGDTLDAFKQLLTDCGLNGVEMEEPWHQYCWIKSAVYSKLGFRQKQIFKLLDARFNLDVYKRGHAAGKRVCVIGAGPVGLRAAVETVMLGGQAVVLEKRSNFIRENLLHLWPWVVQDLASLGARVFFSRFCRSRVYFHVSTRQLQVILLKVALLVGVKVHMETEFSALSPPSDDVSDKPFYSVVTNPQIPMVEFTAVLGACGTNDKLAEHAGINRFVFSRKEALGIVCYFPNLGTTEETKMKEFSWTAQVKSNMLDKMRKVGLDMENIMYYRGEMHYLVMTPKRQNLLERRVVNVNHPTPTDLVKQDNVNESALYQYAERVVNFAGISRKTEFSRVNLFDFSSRTRADKATNILTCNGKKLYVGLIGDSLLEPLWYEGVGTCRGFLGALDTVWMVAQIGRKSDEQLLADRELAYRVMMRLSGKYRDEMQKNVRKYTADPRSRYMVKFPQLP